MIWKQQMNSISKIVPKLFVLCLSCHMQVKMPTKVSPTHSIHSKMCYISGKLPDGSTRLVQFLAKKHKDVYVSVGMEHGLWVTSIIAMWWDARILDGQAWTILQHTRYKFNSPITVPYHRILNPLEGYTQPWHKVFVCQVDGMKYPATVHVKYQDMSKEVQVIEQFVE